MSYTTTKIRPLKSYPTYQFYAKADSKSTDLNNVFKICILETFKWLRARLNKFDYIPPEITTPEPENFADFSLDTLTSFSNSSGLGIEAVYIENKGVWSFRINETDMGANIGTETERLPVNGRTFDTEISFAKQNDCVEIGVRTICSEPSTVTADCEVFRPTVVKALAENPNIRLIHGGFILDEKPLEVTTKADADKLISIYENELLNFPIVIVCDTETEIKTQVIPDINTDSARFNIKGGFSYSGINDLSIDAGSLNAKIKKDLPLKKDKPQKTVKKTYPVKSEPLKTKLPPFDYERLAEKLVGFAIVAFVDERFFRTLENKMQLSLKYGDIIVVRNKKEIERFSYDSYRKNMKDFFKSLRFDVSAMPKRKQYHFGNVLFYSDAKLKEYHTKRHETNSLEEECSIYRLEINELRKQLREISQQQTDMHLISDSLRITQKKVGSLQKELEVSRRKYNELFMESEQKKAAYLKTSELVNFYKQQVEVASTFPTHKDDVCDWIEDYFSDNIILTQRAKSEMRKYSGALDIASLCDGIVYLNAYADLRKRNISEELLQLYGERNNWEVQNCGKVSLKMRKSDYIVTYNDTQYILDLHIKHGVNPEELIRIYFCWDDDLKKLIIGSMPEHLATVKQNT